MSGDVVGILYYMDFCFVFGIMIFWDNVSYGFMVFKVGIFCCIRWWKSVF